MVTFELVKSDAQPPEAARLLLEHWSRLNEQGPRPTRCDFTPFSLKPWLGKIDVYEVVDGGAAFRVRLNGTQVVALTGEDWTGKTASDVDSRFGSTLHEELQGVYRSKRPLAHHIRIYQKDHLSAYRLVLPIFADDREGEIVQIFLVIFRTTG